MHKIFNFNGGKNRLKLNLDAFNVFNINTVTDYSAATRSQLRTSTRRPPSCRRGSSASARRSRSSVARDSFTNGPGHCSGPFFFVRVAEAHGGRSGGHGAERGATGTSSSAYMLSISHVGNFFRCAPLRTSQPRPPCPRPSRDITSHACRSGSAAARAMHYRLACGGSRGGGRLASPRLVLVTLAIYYPAWHGGPLWDDDAHLTQPALQSARRALAHLVRRRCHAAVLPGRAFGVLADAPAVGRRDPRLPPRQHRAPRRDRRF